MPCRGSEISHVNPIRVERVKISSRRTKASCGEMMAMLLFRRETRRRRSKHEGHDDQEDRYEPHNHFPHLHPRYMNSTPHGTIISVVFQRSMVFQRARTVDYNRRLVAVASPLARSGS